MLLNLSLPGFCYYKVGVGYPLVCLYSASASACGESATWEDLVYSSSLLYFVGYGHS